MRLSEAIRLGSMLRPQGCVVMFDHIRTCALGAALEANGCATSEMGGDAVKAMWPELLALSVECPVCAISESAYHVIGEHLNDGHRWTRERIADWVEGLEAAQEIGSPASTNAVREEEGQPIVPLRA